MKERKAEKICSLYVNDMHLVVMLMPYIEKNLEKNEEIVTVFEKGLESELNTLLERTNFTEDKKNNIRKISWNSKAIDKLDSIKNECDGKIFIINGKDDYKKKANKILEGENVKIINCFELNDFEKNSNYILQRHDKILNTMGEKKI